MPLGKNVSLSEKLIKKTTGKTNKGNNTSRKSNKSKKTNENISGKGSLYRNNSTDGTRKMTFYVKEGLLDKLYNFSYWDRHSVTDAFNIVLEEGLKRKNTKGRKFHQMLDRVKKEKGGMNLKAYRKSKGL